MQAQVNSILDSVKVHLLKLILPVVLITLLLIVILGWVGVSHLVIAFALGYIVAKVYLFAKSKGNY